MQIDRRSLPRQEFRSTAEYVAPSGHVEEVIHAAWQAVLPGPDQNMSVHDNFFQVRPTPSVRTRHQHQLHMHMHIPCLTTAS